MTSGRGGSDEPMGALMALVEIRSSGSGDGGKRAFTPAGNVAHLAADRSETEAPIAHGAGRGRGALQTVRPQEAVA